MTALSLSVGIDFNPDNKYNIPVEKVEEESKEPDQDSNLLEQKLNEYIFLIDRSGSMEETIKLARQALQLFIQSLPFGAKFQIVSYGSSFHFLFKGVRSVEYNEKNLLNAFNEVEKFEANLGGTDIFSPL